MRRRGSEAVGCGADGGRGAPQGFTLGPCLLLGKKSLTREPMTCCGDRAVLMWGRRVFPWVFSA